MPTFEMTAIGRVQGVGFRWFVQQCAERTAVHGYVKNMTDGSVQILAQADEARLELFISLIKKGNGVSRIQDMLVSSLQSTSVYDDFTIR